jgi:hypothetical protein
VQRSRTQQNPARAAQLPSTVKSTFSVIICRVGTCTSLLLQRHSDLFPRADTSARPFPCSFCDGTFKRRYEPRPSLAPFSPISRRFHAKRNPTAMLFKSMSRLPSPVSKLEQKSQTFYCQAKSYRLRDFCISMEHDLPSVRRWQWHQRNSLW